MGLNLSNPQIAKQWDLNKDDMQRMTSQLRQGVVNRKPAAALQETVECEEIYVAAGHKGHPSAVKKSAARGAETASKGHQAEARLKRRSPRSLV
jgi:hypothetical protein